MPTKKIQNREELKALCIELVQSFQTPQLVLLEGPLAVGKSQMVRYMAEALGCRREDICSPTFSLINSYQTPEKTSIYHVDFYRLKTLEEVESASFWDILHEPAIVFIEWPGLLKNKLPLFWNKLSVRLEFTDYPESRILSWEFSKASLKKHSV